MQLLIAAGGHGAVEFILLTVVVFFVIAKAVGSLFEHFHVPSIVGKLVAGILLGNAYHVIPELGEWTHAVLGSEFLKVSSELGVIFLLFIVGLETSLGDLQKVGGNALVVAIIGVVLPFAVGYAGGFVLPGFELSNIEKIFLGAALTATSVGITAKVLADCNHLQTVEGQTILGAAVFDDIMGLMILAVVSGLASGAELSAMSVGFIFLKVFLFFVGAHFFGEYVLAAIIRVPATWRAEAMMQSTALVIMFGMAWAASMMGLAPIVGAFMAGVMLEETYFQNYPEAQSQTVDKIMGAITALFLPLFFVVMGMQVDLVVLAKGPVIIATVILTIVAILGKIVAGWGLPRSKGDPLSVGYGMIPRGEVGLVFAAVGLASGAISSEFYGVVVMVVVLTTVIAPIMLRRRIAKLQRRAS